MLIAYLAASLVPLAAAIAEPTDTYDFVSRDGSRKSMCPLTRYYTRSL
jgi:hypothetical protein